MSEAMTTSRKFRRREQAWFVLTDAGRTIHITDPEWAPLTRCGRPWICEADADDVLYFRVCGKCRGTNHE